MIYDNDSDLDNLDGNGNRRRRRGDGDDDDLTPEERERLKNASELSGYFDELTGKRIKGSGYGRGGTVGSKGGRLDNDSPTFW